MALSGRIAPGATAGSQGVFFQKKIKKLKTTKISETSAPHRAYVCRFETKTAEVSYLNIPLNEITRHSMICRMRYGYILVLMSLIVVAPLRRRVHVCEFPVSRICDAGPASYCGVFLSQINVETNVIAGDIAVPHLMPDNRGPPPVLVAPGGRLTELLKLGRVAMWRRRQAYCILSLGPARNPSVILCLLVMAVASGMRLWLLVYG